MQSSKTLLNKRLLLISRPHGNPKAEDFLLDEKYISNIPPNGGLIIQNLFISIDPAMRGWMSSAKSYLPPVKLNNVMRASTVGKVITSDTSRFPVGSFVRYEDGGVQSYTIISEKNLKFLFMLDKSMLPSNSSFSIFLGVLGTTGLTAYFGLLRVGLPKAGDTVLISGAAGATGSVVAQIAKIKGCKVVGTAGSDEKCRWLKDNNLVDIAINYKSNPGKLLSKAIREACPKGVNVIFDNVGSEFLEAALSNLARGARVVLCGAISQYNSQGSSLSTITGPRNYMNLLVKRASMEGFVVFDYRKEYSAAIRELSYWISSGKLKYREDIMDGIENFYPALMSLFTGRNKGKMLLRLTKENERDTVTSLRSKL